MRSMKDWNSGRPSNYESFIDTNAGKQEDQRKQKLIVILLYNSDRNSETVKDIINPFIYFKICKTNPFLHIVFVQHEIIIQ